MKSTLRCIALARIPGLLCGSLEETGSAQLISDSGAAPVRFRADASGALSVEARAVRANAPTEVHAYLQAAAEACGFRVRASEACLWLSADMPARARVLDSCTDFCRLARQITSACAWLDRDPAARTHWAAFAKRAGAIEKGDCNT